MRAAQYYERTHQPTEYEQRVAQVQGIAQRYLNEAAVPLLKDIVAPAAYLQRKLSPQQLGEYGRLMGMLGQDLGDFHWRYTQAKTGERPGDPAQQIAEDVDAAARFFNQTGLAVPVRMRALDQLKELVQLPEVDRVVEYQIDRQGT